MKIQKVKKAILSKQAVLGILTLLVVVAGIINWVSPGQQEPEVITASSIQNNDLLELDDSVEAEASLDYFMQATANRTRARDEAIELLTDSENSDEIINIAKAVQQEVIIEQLIVAKGIEKAFVFIEDGSANVIVKADGLTSEQADMIKDVVVENSDVKTRNIKISEAQ